MNRKDAEIQREEKEIILPENGETDLDLLPVVDGELIEEVAPINKKISKTKDQRPKTETEKTHNSQLIILNYLIVPIIFLTVTLLGGLRLSADTNVFIFLKPALICLILASILILLFFRAGLIQLEGWFSTENYPMLKNIANALVLFTLFTASVQMFNALLPEQGLPFWIIGLLFFWSLWNNLFSTFTAKRLLQSLGSLFGLAFVLKYLVLAYLTAPTSESWLRGLLENPTKEFFTYLLDLPRFSAGTGYIQFFTIIFYLLGLFLLPSEVRTNENH